MGKVYVRVYLMEGGKYVKETGKTFISPKTLEETKTLVKGALCLGEEQDEQGF